MRTLELFCGTKSFSKVMEKHNHVTVTVDANPLHKPDIQTDLINNIYNWGYYDIVWASPPCTTFSVASMGKHWRKELGIPIPKSDYARLGISLLENTMKIINDVKPKYWFIENPRGMMRKVIDPLFKKHGIIGYRRVTVCYCKYGDKRMKPTDIWTNLEGWKGRMCHNGNPDHEAAPRGSRTGTQGLKNDIERGMIPPALFEEILLFI